MLNDMQIICHIPLFQAPSIFFLIFFSPSSGVYQKLMRSVCPPLIPGMERVEKENTQASSRHCMRGSVGSGCCS